MLILPLHTDNYIAVQTYERRTPCDLRSLIISKLRVQRVFSKIIFARHNKITVNASCINRHLTQRCRNYFTENRMSTALVCFLHQINTFFIKIFIGYLLWRFSVTQYIYHYITFFNKKTYDYQYSLSKYYCIYKKR